MENAEVVMQLLEEFSRTRPKEIPRELEDYLCYVAKTGDPVFQWSLVKNLFREKLINVITEFYESTLTVELPPCPNVEPFSYERMKASLLERFDTFCSAPFTVQRICELLTNPRKEYNRADKYMRAIEKNILVVSTREPGSGKRPLESDSQTEAVLNGMPEMKFADGSLMHLPTDMPYLGAPPASNDVTVETSEPTSTQHVKEAITEDVNCEPVNSEMSANKSWQSQESSNDPLSEHKVLSSETCEISSSALGTNSMDKSEFIVVQIQDSNDCGTNDKLSSVTSEDKTNIKLFSNINLENESSPILHTQSNETLLPNTGTVNADSSDSSQDGGILEQGQPITSKTVPSLQDSENCCDENEVSSSPVDKISQSMTTEDEPADSEAESSDKNSLQCLELGTESNTLDLNLTDNDVNSSERAVEAHIEHIRPDIRVNEVGRDTNKSSNLLSVACSESAIRGIAESPDSPSNNLDLEADDGICEMKECKQTTVNEVLPESDQADLHPDSSDDVGCSLPKETINISEEELNVLKPCMCLEADSASNTISDESSNDLQSSSAPEEMPDQTNNENPIGECADGTTSNTSIKTSPHENVVEDLIEIKELASCSGEDSIVTEESCPVIVEEQLKPVDSSISSGSEVQDLSSQEEREESVIHSHSSVTKEPIKEIITIEEISVDPSCETEEEAMDVDDSSNQMMVSEGENESEPMDQSDQQQS